MSKERRVVTVIQARVSSTRLPGKAMLPLFGEPLLVRMVERVTAAKSVGKVIVATTTHEEDNAIVDVCAKHHIEVYRGS